MRLSQQSGGGSSLVARAWPTQTSCLLVPVRRNHSELVCRFLWLPPRLLLWLIQRLLPQLWYLLRLFPHL